MQLTIQIGRTCFLLGITSLTGCNSSTAQVMFKTVDAQMTNHETSWKNWTMMGFDIINITISLSRTKYDGVFSVAYPCHILQKTA